MTNLISKVRGTMMNIPPKGVIRNPSTTRKEISLVPGIRRWLVGGYKGKAEEVLGLVSV